MTDAEQRGAARQFVNRWMGKGKDEDGRSYWIDLLTNVLGMDNVTERLNFEKKVVIDGKYKTYWCIYSWNTSNYWTEEVLEKHWIRKSEIQEMLILLHLNRQTDIMGSWLLMKITLVVTSNFAEIWIYDMSCKKLKANKDCFRWITKQISIGLLGEKEVKTISHEMEVSIKAGGIVEAYLWCVLKQYRIPDIKEKDEAAFEQKETHN